MKSTKQNTEDLAIQVQDELDRIEDPEVAITLKDLGVLRDANVTNNIVTVNLRPTRLACPARSEIERRVRFAVNSVDPDLKTKIVWENAAWEVVEIRKDGATSLIKAGFSDPRSFVPTCPYCNSSQIKKHGSFGGGPCRIPFTCLSCGSTFDAIKGSGTLETNRSK